MKNLFKSKTSYEILDFLSHTELEFFSLNDLVCDLKKDPANVSRELTRLVKEGILNIAVKNKKKVYSLNKNYYAYNELKALFQKTRKEELASRFQGEWLLAEEIMNIDPTFSNIWLDFFVDNFSHHIGRAYKKVACLQRGYHLWFYYDKKDALELADHLVNKFISDPNFMTEINKNIYLASDKLKSFVEKISESSLNKKTNTELLECYLNYRQIHSEAYEWFWIPPAADMFGNNLTNYAKRILKEKNVPSEKIEEYLAILTQPDRVSLIKQEQDELALIGVKIQADKKQFNICQELFRKFKEEEVKFFGLYTHSPEYEKKFEESVKVLRSQIRPDILNDIEKHYTKYFYTKFIYTEEQGVYTFEYYLKNLIRLVNGESDIIGAMERDKKEFKALLVERNQLIEKLKLTTKEKMFFANWGEFMITKIYRRYTQLLSLYKINFILMELASRFNISLKELKFMTIEEIKETLAGDIIDLKMIKERMTESVYYADKQNRIYYSGTEAKKIITYLQKEEDLIINELNGQCGSRGQARGRVKIVNDISDMTKMNQGDILVSISTQPDLLPAMKKAAAFITDQGGVTSHAAIVAR
ncbi:MAG: PEP-utilizing enzyme, partial [Planctomycetes bacterium]|nr:PEP-utilizing enzyme [Planctomycetota bacterium]